MNFLAHLYLAGDAEEALMGNLMGDFVKGRLERLPYPAPIVAGIRLHRLTDIYTDAHPLVVQSRARISPERRRFAGIIIDMAYDHFLARHWPRFAPQPLGDFTDRVYRLLLERNAELPPRLRQIVPYMAEQDWLGSYSELANVGYALDRISRRFRRETRLPGAVAELAASYADLEADFLEFFPQLMRYVESVRESKR